MSAALKLLARSGDLLALGMLTIPGFQETWFHAQVAQLVGECVRFAQFGGERGGCPRGLISLPRRHGKSTFCGELGPASLLGAAPHLKVLNTAYAEQLAGERVEGTRRIMTSAGWPFPVRLGSAIDETTGKTTSTRDKSFNFRTLLRESDGSITEPGGSYQAVGIGGGATGHGFHLGIADDWTKNAEEALSYIARKKRERFYDTCFESGQEGSGAALLGVATMWAKPDFLEWLHEKWIAQGFKPKWLRLPALRPYPNDDRTGADPPLGYELQDDPREPGEGLWIPRDGKPGKFSTAYYEGIRAGLIHSGNIEAWLALWQQDPRGLGGVIFPKDAWRYFGPSFDLGHIERQGELHMSVDPNVKETGRSFGSIGVYGVTDLPGHGIQYFKVDRVRGHWDYSALRANVKRAWSKWSAEFPNAASHPTAAVWVEDKANGPALMSDPELAHIPLRPVPKSRGKETCYRLAAPVMREGRVRLPHGDFPPGHPCSAHWVQGDGGFVEECFAQQPVREPNDDPDQFAQMIICREPNLGAELLRL